MHNILHGIENNADGFEKITVKIRRWIGCNHGFKNNVELTEQEMLAALEGQNSTNLLNQNLLDNLIFNRLELADHLDTEQVELHEMLNDYMMTNRQWNNIIVDRQQVNTDGTCLNCMRSPQPTDAGAAN